MATSKPFTGNPNNHDTAKFADGMTGTCLCGSISVTINDSELFTKRRGHLCHCSNCRKVSGSYVAANFAIETKFVDIKDTKGALKRYEDRDTGSGNPVIRCFCGDCGSPIMSLPTLTPHITVLKMGLFPRIPVPEAEAFAAHRHEWQGQHDGVVQFETVRGGKKLGE